MNDRAIIFSGGVGHPFEETSPALANIIGDAGWQPSIETDLGTALCALAEVSLLAVNALYWSMTQHERYIPLRDQWARSLEDPEMDAIEQYVHRGGRLFVLHTATICWDTQPRWIALMGGGWNWERSHHPPLGAFIVDLTDAGSRMTDGAEHFEVIDEAYHNLSPSADCTVLATADLGEGPQSLAWIRAAGEGKVAVDALGHDRRSLDQPVHRALIHAQLNWLSS